MNLSIEDLRVGGSGDRDIFYGILKTRPGSILISLRNVKTGQDLVFRHPLKNGISPCSDQMEVKIGGE